jgi:hypothetical protein
MKEFIYIAKSFLVLMLMTIFVGIVVGFLFGIQKMTFVIAVIFVVGFIGIVYNASRLKI